MSTYPVWLSGQRITATKLDSGLPQYAWKGSSTDRASLTVVAPDPDLTMTLDANAVTFVEFFIYFGGVLDVGSGGDLRTDWLTPSGATGFKAVQGPGSNAAASSSADTITTVRSGVHGFGTDIAYANVRNDIAAFAFAYESGIVTTTTSGTCALQWAQVASNATATRVAIGSMMRITRLA